MIMFEIILALSASNTAPIENQYFQYTNENI